MLNANRDDDGHWLNAYNDKPDDRWNRDNGFAFSVSQISSFLPAVQRLVQDRRGVLFYKLTVPTAQHPADFVHGTRYGDVFLTIKRFCFPNDKKEDFYGIDFADGDAHNGEFILSRAEDRRADSFNSFYEQVVNPLAECVPMDLGNGLVVGEPTDVGVFGFLKDWQNRRGGATIQAVPGKRCGHSYKEIISVENLLDAWQEFVRGKRGRADVQEYELDLMGNLFDLHRALVTQAYIHGPYEAFTVSDPKTRSIHKATVTDRVLHRALYRKLYPFFDRTFIADSFSCRNNKGTHKALDRFQSFAHRASNNHTRTVWVLKCDVRKFFASIDHGVLLQLLEERIEDKRIMWLLGQVIGSFASTHPGVGLPLGNLTSQLFANIYMNPLDQFVKHFLKAYYYIRYADDFVLLSPDKTYLEATLDLIRHFLHHRLRLNLHPNKITISTVASGVDFLGWVHFPDHRVLRTSTKKRLLCASINHPSLAAVASYVGLLQHGHSRKLEQIILGSSV